MHYLKNDGGKLFLRMTGVAPWSSNLTTTRIGPSRTSTSNSLAEYLSFGMVS